MKRVLLSATMFFLLTWVHAQPSNNTCATATNITFNNTCLFNTYNLDSATFSGNATPACGSQSPKDIWFSFTVPTSGNVVIQTTYVNTLLDMAVYTGICGSLNSYVCDQSSGTNFAMPYMYIRDTALAGQTMYLQVWDQSGGTTGSAKLCVFEPVVPTNSECDNRIGLTVGTACNYTTYTNVFAGTSAQGLASCEPALAEDVWFEVTVPNSGNLIINSINYGIANGAFAIYTGTCGNLSQLNCISGGGPNFAMPYINIQDTALAGDLLIIRYWKEGGNYRHGGSFGICAYEPSLAPNRNCQNAQMITPSLNCNYSSYSNTNLLGSGEVTPSCGAYIGAELWFKTIIPSSGKLVLSTRNVTIGNSAMAVYTGACGNLTLYECNQGGSVYFAMPEIIINDPNMAGDTVYFIIWKENSKFGGSVDLCVFEPIIPDNANCNNAEELTVNTSCNFASYTNLYAQTSGEGNPNCGAYLGSDVWFKFIVPSSGEFTIDTRPGTYNNMDMALYTGTCGSLTLYDCDDNSSSFGFSYPKIVVNDSTLVNQYVFVQVWRHNSINGGDFDICVSGNLTPEIVNPQGGEICAGDPYPILSVFNGVFQYNWFDQAVGGTLLAGDTNQYFPGTPGTYYVQAVNTTNQTSSARVAIDFIENQIPILSGVQGFSGCSNNPIDSLRLTDLGDQYNWYDSLSGGQLVAFNTASFLPGQNGTYYVEAVDTASGCTSQRMAATFQLDQAPIIVNAQGFTGCADQVIPPLRVNDLGEVYIWYSDSTLNTIVAYDTSQYHTLVPGNYFVRALDTSTGCYSNVQGVTLLIYPTVPIYINQTGNQLIASSAPNYAWYKDSVLLIGEVDSTLNLMGNGTYYVQYTNASGCVITSNVVVITSIGIDEHNQVLTKVYPNPFQDFLRVECGGGSEAVVSIYNANGALLNQRKIYGSDTIDTDQLAGGLYFVQITDARGHVHIHKLVK